ncbi:MAG: DUF4242 domain-containing protein [Chloroflexi bacterium]|nr:DUF4242 domain-containing protein [Chloroflexota bacterium]
MPYFMIERTFAERLEMSPALASQVRLANDDVGVQWLFSFLSADQKKTYCVYEASSADAIRQAARRLNIPADAVIELTGRISPDGNIRGVIA